MSPEAQRIAIAEACGWKSIHGGDGRRKTWWGGSIREKLPNYLSDLNTMHEVEKVLTSSQQMDYMRKLFYKFGETFGAIHATAAQRAEAFLRTLNLWDDKK